MGRMMILNGSPRASKSNSREFAQLLKRSYPGATLEYNLASQNHRDICSALESCSNLVFVFPLYVDCLPCCMLDFLSCLEKSPPRPQAYRSPDRQLRLSGAPAKQGRHRHRQAVLPEKRLSLWQQPFDRQRGGHFADPLRPVCQGSHPKAGARHFLRQDSDPFDPDAEAERYWLKAGGKNGLSAQQMRSTTIESKGASSQKA